MTLPILKESPIDVQASPASNTSVAADTAALKPSNNNGATAIGGRDLSTNLLLASNEGEASPTISEPIAHLLPRTSPDRKTVTLEHPVTGSCPTADVVPHPSGPTSLNSLGGTASATEVSLNLNGVANATNASITPVSPAGAVDLPGEDVVMGDTTSSRFRLPTDEEAPMWLFEMMEYLRRVADDATWHSLLTEFVDFESRGPPNGVSCDFTIINLYLLLFPTQQNLPVKLRPKAISDWIKSKKKTVMPTLDAGLYGKWFKDWWTAIQPSWRVNGGSLSREVPWDETWQMLRKGGTSGVYTVIMGLSWWIAAQHTERDVIAWDIVDDFTWVLQQLKKGMHVASPLPPKRARDDDAEDEEVDQPRKR
jgi:hypothetical protein